LRIVNNFLSMTGEQQERTIHKGSSNLSIEEQQQPNFDISSASFRLAQIERSIRMNLHRFYEFSFIEQLEDELYAFMSEGKEDENKNEEEEDDEDENDEQQDDEDNEEQETKKTPKQQTPSHKQQPTTPQCLVIHFTDPYCRYLAHGICNYYLLQSKSVDYQGDRVTVITKTVAQQLPLPSMPLSTYLKQNLEKTLKKKEDADAAAAQQVPNNATVYFKIIPSESIFKKRVQTKKNAPTSMSPTSNPAMNPDIVFANKSKNKKKKKQAPWARFK